MGTAHATITFTAKSEKEAAELVAGWTLHEGAAVEASFVSSLGVGDAGEDGTPALEDYAARAARANEVAPPRTAPADLEPEPEPAPKRGRKPKK